MGHLVSRLGLLGALGIGPLLGLTGIATSNISRPFGKGKDRTWRDSPSGRKKRVLANRRKAARKHRVR